MMTRWAVPAMMAVVLLVAVPLAPPAAAVDVHFVVIAFGTNWHLASTSSAPKPTITVDPGDVLRLQVHNHDPMNHTFTFPHFGVDVFLAPGSDANPTIVFVNITTTSQTGKWQFYCKIPSHTTGSDPNRDGMVGWVQVGSPAPAPGFEVLLVITALGMVAVAVRSLSWRRR